MEGRSIIGVKKGEERKERDYKKWEMRKLAAFSKLKLCTINGLLGSEPVS